MSANGQAACALDGVSLPPSQEHLIEIEEALSRLIDMSDVLCDLATSAQEGNEILSGSLYFLSDVLLGDARRLQVLYRHKAVSG